MQTRQVVITRSQIGLFGSILTAVGVLLTLGALLWQSGFSDYALFTLITAGVGLVLWVVATPGEFVGFITGRQARRSVISIFSAALLIGIVALGYSILERAVLTLDMTESQEFTLSPATRDLLDRVEQLDRPIQITAFYEPADARLRELDDQVFRLYETSTAGLIRREYIDPIEQPVVASSFIGFGGPAQSGDVFVSFVDESGTVNPGGANPVDMSGAQERQMSQAISRLLARGQFTVYFAIGSGELNPGVVDGTGIALAAQVLTDNNINIAAINLFEVASVDGDVPGDASAMVLPRPQRSLTQAEIDVLDRYLNRGGGLFITADLTLDENGFLREGTPFNEYLWENWGLRMLDAVAIDSVASDPTPTDLLAFGVSDNEITQNIDPADPEFQVNFRVARPIEVDDTPPVSNGSLIFTAEAPVGYGETDLETFARTNTYEPDTEVDIPGPLTTAAWARDDDTGGEVILVGDSDFLTDGFITNPRGNFALFTDGIGWMSDFNETVSIEPRGFAGSAPLIFVSPAQLDQIAFITAFLMPGIVLLAGVSIWFVRNRR
jgi:hypothetical protein